jgi:hypothetical protein
VKNIGDECDDCILAVDVGVDDCCVDENFVLKLKSISDEIPLTVDG